MTLHIRPLDDKLDFGVRISGLTREMTGDEAIRTQINAAFEQAGMIVFENVEPSNAMQLALSNVFGPLKEHPVKSIARVDAEGMPGVIELRSSPDSGGIVEVNGKQVSHWLPWHFDHCYNDELNRAGILRAAKITPAGGLTGFLDGISLYKLFPADLLARIEGAEILYTLNSHYETQRFSNPPDLKVLRSKPMGKDFEAQARAMPRAIHPAIWTRVSGEKVLHVSPYMAEGIVGHEDSAGDALFAEITRAINELAAQCSYHHAWKPTEMLIWDNWRMLHAVSGHDPAHERIMYRTTIKGDYGLGRFENRGVGGRILQDTII
ncbi:TauD/TfdA dioxygenase family protein [Novosphingobium album (ex Liu et al. 2023)]|uniref:TauD/TfdA family dioxygenase n=1 Tax=Novosphingobium album (ex Liu et al. 2023) TaxID=3031130 RepID=A0ABT5WLR4_9SPHN|nr:TauD/TfdA family dioxygenase [Novosphingobium album (ex Liu et al. 2023)]MDE8650992.1 TauD/TfdA family dioxygenase [Novosphingobium album (ex Liu et al. 2023)]